MKKSYTFFYVLFFVSSSFLVAMAPNCLDDLTTDLKQLHNVSAQPKVQAVPTQEYPKDLFVGFELPDDVSDYIGALQDDIKAIVGNKSVTYIKKQDLHVGICYLAKQAQFIVDAIKTTLQDIVNHKHWIKREYELTFEKTPILITPQSNMSRNKVALWFSDSLLDALFLEIDQAISDVAPYRYERYLQHMTLGSIFTGNRTIKNKALVRDFERTLSTIQLKVPSIPFRSFSIAGSSGIQGQPYRQPIYLFDLMRNDISPELRTDLKYPFIMVNMTQQHLQAIQNEGKKQVYLNKNLQSIAQRYGHDVLKTPMSAKALHLTLYEAQSMNEDQVYQRLQKIFPKLVDIYNEHKQNIYLNIGGYHYSEEGDFSDETLRPRFGKLKFIPGSAPEQELLVVPVYGKYLNDFQEEIQSHLKCIPSNTFNTHIVIAECNQLSQALKKALIKKITIQSDKGYSREPFKATMLTLYEIKNQLGQQYFPVYKFGL